MSANYPPDPRGGDWGLGDMSPDMATLAGTQSGIPPGLGELSKNNGEKCDIVPLLVNAPPVQVWVSLPVLGRVPRHMLRHVPEHMPGYVLKHVPKHLLRHMSHEHAPTIGTACANR